jgi:hypothetical protein
MLKTEDASEIAHESCFPVSVALYFAGVEGVVVGVRDLIPLWPLPGGVGGE